MELDFSKRSITFAEFFSLFPEVQVYESLIGHKLSFRRLFTSVLRLPNNPDNTPSLGFTESRGRVYWKDYGTGKQGNAIDFLKEYYKCEYKDIYSNYIRDNNKKTIVNYSDDKGLIKIGVEFGSYIANDFSYWRSYHVDYKTLISYNVKHVSRIFDKITGNTLAVYTESSPIFCYDQLGERLKSFQIYRPFAPKRRKFINVYKGGNIIFGENNLDWTNDTLIITKSMKDVLVLRTLGYNSIALSSESAILPFDAAKRYKRRFKDIYVLYDQDDAGIRGSNSLCLNYSFKQIFIDDAKDISDYVREKGVLAGAALIQRKIGEAGTVEKGNTKFHYTY